MQVWGNPPTRWAVWSGSVVQSEIEGAGAGAMGSATSGGTGVAGHDPVVIDSTPNTPPAANVPPEAGPDDTTPMEHPSAGARSLEPAPSVSRPSNYQAALQVPQTTSSSHLYDSELVHIRFRRAFRRLACAVRRTVDGSQAQA